MTAAGKAKEKSNTKFLMCVITLTVISIFTFLAKCGPVLAARSVCFMNGTISPLTIGPDVSSFGCPVRFFDGGK